MSSNTQGTGKANPNPMIKHHGGQGQSSLGTHKQRFTSNESARAQANGSPKTSHTGQITKK